MASQNGNAAADEARGVPGFDQLGGKVDRENSLKTICTQARGGPLWPIVVHGRGIGTLLSRGIAGIEAFDRDDHSLGTFRTLHDAAAAIVERVRA